MTEQQEKDLEAMYVFHVKEGTILPEPGTLHAFKVGVWETMQTCSQDVERLEQWKREASEVLKELDFQEIGKELGLPLGTRVSTQVLPTIKYLKERLKAAELYIQESPCDPDITEKQFAAYNAWTNLKKAKIIE